MSLRTSSTPSCAAHMPAHGVFCGPYCGTCLPSDRLSGGSSGGASSPRLHVPSLRASCGGVPSMPVSFRDSSSSGSGLLLLLDKPSWGGGSGSGISGARFGLLSLTRRPSHGGSGGTSSPRLPMPIAGPSRGSDPSSPESGHGNDSGGVGGSGWSLLHTAFSALGSNALGLAAVAFTALLAGSMLVVPLVGAGTPSASNDAPPGSCALVAACAIASVPAFSAT
jgi:hypothetical protein